MFSGIIRAISPVLATSSENGSLRIRVATPEHWQLKVGDSVATHGVCLTVAETGPGWHEHQLIPETLSKTVFGRRVPAVVNLEQSLRMGDPLHGHVVTGHVDCVGRIESVQQEGDSWRLSVSFPETFKNLIAEKGSIAIDGVSLTVASVSGATCTVALIKHTHDATTLGAATVGTEVNIEFDIIAKHLEKMARSL
jgi:riboflavin synthase